MNATFIKNKNYQNLFNVVYGQAGDYGWAYGNNGSTPFTDARGNVFNGIRGGTSDVAIQSTMLNIILLRVYTSASYFTLGINGSSLDEDSYTADDSVSANVTTTALYYPNAKSKRITITNNEATPITFDQIGFRNTFYVGTYQSTATATTMYFGFIVFDESVTLQSNESISLLIDFN